MSETKDLSSQVQDTTKNTASKEHESPDNLESIPRSGAGVVNDAGDVLDDAGNIVGKIADTDNLKDLIGNTVNTAGDVVSSSGNVLGKTLPIGQGEPEEEDDSHDEAKSEYTTQSKDKKSGSLGDTVGSVTGAVGETAKNVGEIGKDAAGGVTDSLGGKSVATSQATDTKTPAETPKAPGVTDETSDVKSEDQEKDQEQKDISLEDRDVLAEGEDKLKEVVPEEAKETTDKAEDNAKDAPEDAKDILEEAKDNVTSKVDEQDVPKPEDVEDKLQEKTEDVPKPEDVEDKLQEKTEGAKDDVPKSEAPEVPEGDVPKSKAPGNKIPSGEAPGDDGDKSMASGDDLKSVAPGEEAAGVTDEVKSKAAEGEEDAEGKAIEGEETAEGKVPEGEEAAADLTDETKDKAAKGEEAAGDLPEDVEGKAAEGEETAEGKVAEGEEAAGGVGKEAKDKAAEGEEAVEDKAAEGEEAAKEPLDFTILKGTTVEKEGNLVNEKGDKLGKVVEGELKQLIGLYSDDQGIIWDKTGKQLGKAEPIPEWDREQKDFSILKDTTVDNNGNLVNDKGHLIGRVIEGEIKQLIGLTSDDQGTIWDRTGMQVGKAEPLPEWERGEQKDYSILKGTTVDKDGNLINEKGHLFGKVIEGEIKQLIGLASDDQGTIWNRTGMAVGKAEPLPEWERGEQKDFSILKGAVVYKEGGLVNDKGDTIGKQKTAAGEATPEEAHLANLLKELSTEIQTTIEEGKRKLEGMPHAKKEINPLWALLAEPLFQIVAAVGLLLSGVLGLVGKLLGPILSPLLNGLGLGGLLDGLLGGLGLKKILSGLGLGVVVGTVTGKK
ncbi:hypothetical protein FOPG_18400 [Fusarium oxysporum f. sp. conglutinans race 2 54008]|uniref:DUF6987 domain-containing protein n=1 Tax=Fusarium oxysporum f. sp. conglutinans race 2 54008 TaxID=1089457 RepID=X0GP53_FUSOX|nr:hypothetical protein FOPG_18400 [Fusarium oxysporum f. sp. conglutinans race 2 54008]